MPIRGPILLTSLSHYHCLSCHISFTVFTNVCDVQHIVRFGTRYSACLLQLGSNLLQIGLCRLTLLRLNSMHAQRKYWTTTSGPPILWRPASRERGRQDELSSDECSSPPRNYCIINQEMVKRGGFSFAPDWSRSISVSSNQDSYLLTSPMGTDVQLDQEGCHSDTSSTFTRSSDTSEAI